MKYSRRFAKVALFAVFVGAVSIPSQAKADTASTIKSIIGSYVVCETRVDTSLSKIGDLILVERTCPAGTTERLNMDREIESVLLNARLIAQNEIRLAGNGGLIKRLQTITRPVYAQPGGALPGYAQFVYAAMCPAGWYAISPASLNHVDPNAVISSQVGMPHPTIAGVFQGYNVTVRHVDNFLPGGAIALLGGNFALTLTCASNTAL